jgi:hypothetical protein|tara:strand:+ start:1938 stop:2273 length:336 start_codon:yes stop_codon:yes gene_type:complete
MLILILSIIFIAIMGLLVKFKVLGFFLYLLPYIMRNLGNLSKSYSKSKTNNPTSMNEDEAYEILGLNPGDDLDKIEEAYRNLIKKNHPDRGGSEYIAKKINSARETLIKSR